MALQLPLGYIAMFLPTDSQIIEIGRLVIEEKSAEYADTVQWIDMYDSTFEDRLDAVKGSTYKRYLGSIHILG
ncbi:hypothetical protein Tco_0797861 [Tanacetum coccineum]